jgi:hypothetical protein
MSLDKVQVISPALESVLVPATAEEAEALSRLVSLQAAFIKIFQQLGATVVTELPPDE